MLWQIKYLPPAYVDVKCDTVPILHIFNIFVHYFASLFVSPTPYRMFYEMHKVVIPFMMGA